jgi:hypothetical protein
VDFAATVMRRAILGESRDVEVPIADEPRIQRELRPALGVRAFNVQHLGKRGGDGRSDTTLSSP